MNRRDRSFKNLTASKITMCPVQIGEGASAEDNFATAVGCQASAGLGSAAFGHGANATSISSLAVGTGATTYPSFSASSIGSVAIGPNTKATNVGSVAVGRDAEASGTLSTAIGGSLIEASFAIPNNKTVASGPGSIAIGSGAVSLSNYLALGSANAVLQTPAETMFTQSNVLYIRVNNSANLFAIPMMLTDIPATPVI
jgi:hypothetical protein